MTGVATKPKSKVTTKSARVTKPKAKGKGSKEDLAKLTNAIKADKQHLEAAEAKYAVRIGENLTRAKVTRWYKATHETFEDYVRENFGWGPNESGNYRWVYRCQRSLAEDRFTVFPLLVAVARPLRRFEKDPMTLHRVWRAILAKYGDRPTVDQVKDACDCEPLTLAQASDKRHKAASSRPVPGQPRMTTAPKKEPAADRPIDVALGNLFEKVAAGRPAAEPDEGESEESNATIEPIARLEAVADELAGIEMAVKGSETGYFEMGRAPEIERLIKQIRESAKHLEAKIAR